MTRGYANREERREYESVSRKVIPVNAPFATRPGIWATLRAMKCLPALALPLLLSACASDVSPEDRDFFYRGWKNPEQSSRERMYGRKYVERTERADVRHQMPKSETADER